MRISIDKVITILSIIGEEDSIGLDQDQEVQDAIALLQAKIEAKVASGELHPDDTLVTFN
jgi:hypothetical protein